MRKREKISLLIQRTFHADDSAQLGHMGIDHRGLEARLAPGAPERFEGPRHFRGDVSQTNVAARGN
jgi:hypothetical protein